MPIKFSKNPTEILSRLLSDIKSTIPKAGPYIKNNFVYAIATAMAFRFYDSLQPVKDLIKQRFPHTSTDEFLFIWGGYKNIIPIGATIASGYITIQGVDGSFLPAETEFQSSGGNIYKSVNDATISLNTNLLASITRTGGTATATALTDHNYATGMSLTISGCVETQYNGSFEIVVTGTDTFTFSVTGSPATPATGTPQADFTGAQVLLESVDEGDALNLVSGDQVTLLTPVSGVTNEAYVQYGEISGGSDAESTERYRSRVDYVWKNPVAMFNEAAIVSKARELPFVDRVFVQKITPAVGYVTVYFTTNGTNLLPTSSQVALVKAALDTLVPSNMQPDDCIVASPTSVPVNFSISSLTPSSVSMQNAVIASLTALFKNTVEAGKNLTQASFLAAIYHTVDPDTGLTVSSFTVSSPSADVTIASNEMATLGTITFS